jgi:hypothetical protein
MIFLPKQAVVETAPEEQVDQSRLEACAPEQSNAPSQSIAPTEFVNVPTPHSIPA